jgi:hypothetical protein
VDIRISNYAIAPLYIASFVMYSFQYFRVNPERRVLNLRFLLMVATVTLQFATVFLDRLGLSPVFFLLALFLLGLSFYLLRFMPPPSH